MYGTFVAGDGTTARQKMPEHIRSLLRFVDTICMRYPACFEPD